MGQAHVMLALEAYCASIRAQSGALDMGARQAHSNRPPPAKFQGASDFEMVLEGKFRKFKLSSSILYLGVLRKHYYSSP
jgi:hypothetical protein